MSDNEKSIYTFSKVLKFELKLLKSLRTGNTGTTNDDRDTKAKECKEKHQDFKSFRMAHKANLAGLAFSGGGIRSATFNLGVIQALCKTKRSTKTDNKKQNNNDSAGKNGLLPLFDYLSTVSGGGYIGCWLTAFLHREGGNKKLVNEEVVREMQARVSTRPCSFGAMPDDDSMCASSSGFDSPRTSGFPPLEHRAIRHLRRFSNYLSPRLGISGDLLAVISLFLRNIVVLQLGLISLVATVLLIPYLVSSISVYAIDSGNAPDARSLMFFLLGTAVMTCTLLIWQSQFRDIDNRDQLRQAQKRSGRWMVFSMVLLLAGFWLVISSLIPGLAAYASAGEIPTAFIFIYATLYFIAWNLSPGTTFFSSEHSKKTSIKRIFIAFTVSILFGLLIHYCAVLFHEQLFVISVRMTFATVFGPPIVLLITSFAIAVQLGLSRDLFREKEREWWGRTGGLTLLAAGLWLLIFSTAIYAPAFVRWLSIGGWAVFLGWASTSGVGAWLARNMTQAGTSVTSAWKPLLMRMIPWFFLIGMAVFISYGLNLIFMAFSFKVPFLTHLVPIPSSAESSMMWLLVYYSMLAESVTTGQALFMLASFSSLFLLLSWRTDLNIFSAHAIYKNRLVRAYLGASNLSERIPHPFTGFDRKDDIALTDLARQRPIPIINTTINMTGGDDLAWQTRRAASFTFTPEFVGFDAKSSKGKDLGGFRKTADYARCKTLVNEPEKKAMTLGTVLAISGAAASPNMGYHTSATVSALLTVFNLRLGYWAGNPADRKDLAASKSPGFLSNSFNKLRKLIIRAHLPSWRRQRPVLSALPLISELTGSANAESNWINLTDGGHFDNLGIYELIRRRCRFIVVTDAGCDPEYHFEDLANSVRKCWTDFGVHIFFPELNKIAAGNNNERCCQQHGSLGLIEYPDRRRPNESDPIEKDKERYGLLLYLKCSLTKFEFENFVDIRQYCESHEKFPHEPTSDQFFDENQFEAYRHLGYCIAEQYRPTIEKFIDSETGRLNKKAIFEEAKKLDKIQSEIADQKKRG